jgi:hypothetical protein
MKKIIIAFSGSRFSEGAFSFVEKINQRDRILVTGLFLPEVTNVFSYSGGLPSAEQLEQDEKKDLEAVLRNIEYFRVKCKKNDIDYTVHNNYYKNTFDEIGRETRFADVMVMSGNSFYPQAESSNHSKYMRQAFHRAECPVLVVPDNFTFPRSILLAYDGSSSSVYSIKQFAQIFPELCNRKALLVFVCNEGNDLPHKTEIEELARLHFHDLQIKRIDSDAEEYFNKTIVNCTNEILVTGSYGRSWLSELFKKSTVEKIIMRNQVAVFIAHK